LVNQIKVSFFNSNNIKLAKKGGGMLSLCNRVRKFKRGLRYSFTFQGTSNKRQRTWKKGPFSFRVKLPPVTTRLSTHW